MLPLKCLGLGPLFNKVLYGHCKAAMKFLSFYQGYIRVLEGSIRVM